MGSDALASPEDATVARSAIQPARKDGGSMLIVYLEADAVPLTSCHQIMHGASAPSY